MKKFEIGDRVRFSSEFLRSIMAYTGPEAPTSEGPFARGTIRGFHDFPSNCLTLARILWDDRREGYANLENIEKSRG